MWMTEVARRFKPFTGWFVGEAVQVRHYDPIRIRIATRKVPEARKQRITAKKIEREGTIQQQRQRKVERKLARKKAYEQRVSRHSTQLGLHRRLQDSKYECSESYEESLPEGYNEPVEDAEREDEVSVSSDDQEAENEATHKSERVKVSVNRQKDIQDLFKRNLSGEEKEEKKDELMSQSNVKSRNKRRRIVRELGGAEQTGEQIKGPAAWMEPKQTGDEHRYNQLFGVLTLYAEQGLAQGSEASSQEGLNEDVE